MPLHTPSDISLRLSSLQWLIAVSIPLLDNQKQGEYSARQQFNTLFGLSEIDTTFTQALKFHFIVSYVYAHPIRLIT